MTKKLAAMLVVVLSATLAQAGLYVNAGSFPDAEIGPSGTNTSYVTYRSAPENDTSGTLETYTGVSFAEGGLAGTYDVGLAVSWTTNGVEAANTVKQAFSRSATQNLGGYNDFWANWIGLDSRTSQDGIGAGTTMTLSLTGLAADQEYTLTSYHFDPNNQAGTFTTSASGDTVYVNARYVATDLTQDPMDYAYDFTLTSDASGSASIDYVNVSGSWNSLNGFDLVAVPEPATLGLVAVFGGGVLFIRRRFMI